MENIKKQSSFRVLLLLNILFNKEYCKKEILEEFQKLDIPIKKTSINNYINKLKANNIPITVKQVKNTNYYSIDKNVSIPLKFLELSALSDVKNILISSKNIDLIKCVMRVFYKFALYAEDDDTKFELMDFD